MSDDQATTKINYAAQYVTDGLARVDAALSPLVRHAEATGSDELRLAAVSFRAALAEALQHTAEWAGATVKFINSQSQLGLDKPLPPPSESDSAATGAAIASSTDGGADPFQPPQEPG